MEKDPWWKDGIRFECQGSGKCCALEGEEGFVYLTAADEKRLAKFLKLSPKKFQQNYCDKTDGLLHLQGVDTECIFLKKKACSVYEARPTQCRTWPFWPENMKAKTWTKKIATFCPGVGKGRLWSQEEVSAELTKQKLADDSDIKMHSGPKGS